MYYPAPINNRDPPPFCLCHTIISSPHTTHSVTVTTSLTAPQLHDSLTGHKCLSGMFDSVASYFSRNVWHCVCLSKALASGSRGVRGFAGSSAARSCRLMLKYIYIYICIYNNGSFFSKELRRVTEIVIK